MTATCLIAVGIRRRAIIHIAVAMGLLMLAGCGRSPQQLEADRLKSLGCDVRFRAVGQSLDVFWVEAPHRQLPVDFMKSLEQFKSLETLILANAKLQDDDIAALPALPRLKLLDVSHNDLSDRALTQFSRVTSLETLVLDGNHITDRSVEDLKQLRSLRALCIRNTDVSEAGLKQLRDALPQCLIETAE
jgi:hypothetical protein